MKPLLTAFLLSVAAGPALALGLGNITPVLTYPDPAPAPETVTQDDAGIDK